MTPRADLADATVGQIMIPVSDLDRAIAFYRDTLGCRFLFSAPPQMSFFMAGNVRLLVGVPEKAEQRTRGGAVYFKVKDIRAVYETLRGSGVVFAAEPSLVHRTTSSDLWLAEFSDPDGNMLVLMSEVAKEG